LHWLAILELQSLHPLGPGFKAGVVSGNNDPKLGLESGQ
jgi:hypothetical protein